MIDGTLRISSCLIRLGGEFLKFSITYLNAPKWSFREQYGLFVSPSNLSILFSRPDYQSIKIIFVDIFVDIKHDDDTYGSKQD